MPLRGALWGVRCVGCMGVRWVGWVVGRGCDCIVCAYISIRHHGSEVNTSSFWILPMHNGTNAYKNAEDRVVGQQCLREAYSVTLRFGTLPVNTPHTAAF